ncbi:hypothetical protein C8Q73DRAFT_694000, partial [Cubamyces lactineus]
MLQCTRQPPTQVTHFRYFYVMVSWTGLAAGEAISATVPRLVCAIALCFIILMSDWCL